MVLCASHVNSRRPSTQVSIEYWVLGRSYCRLSSVNTAHELLRVNMHVCWRFFSNMFYRDFDLYKLGFLSFLHGTTTTAICGQVESVGVCPSFEVIESQERSLWLYSVNFLRKARCDQVFACTEQAEVR